MDADGRLTEPVTDFVGQYVKDADRAIIAKLKGEGRIVAVATEHHSYPFCWRSDTPLLYKVQTRARAQSTRHPCARSCSPHAAAWDGILLCARAMQHIGPSYWNYILELHQTSP